MVDEFARECPHIDTDTSLPAARVIAALDTLATERGLPRALVVDHGPEFISRRSTSGRIATVWSSPSFDRAKPSKMPTSRAFTAAFATSVSPPTGFWISSMPASRLSDGGGTTTRHGPTRVLGTWPQGVYTSTHDQERTPNHPTLSLTLWLTPLRGEDQYVRTRPARPNASS